MIKKRKTVGLIADNRKARFEYTLEKSIECGLELYGTEVKSLRLHKLSFRDSFCSIERGELWLNNLHIALYAFASSFNHHSDRRRRVLAHKREIQQMWRKVSEKGYSLIPVKLYFKGSLVKVEIALGKGKNMHDKRFSIRQRDLDRDLGRQGV